MSCGESTFGIWTAVRFGETSCMISDRILKTRAETWETDMDGKPARRTLGIANLGGATLDNEENYLIKKLFTGGLGLVALSNQARI